MRKFIKTEYNKKWYLKNKKRHLARVKEVGKQIRSKVLHHYGNKCVCCGEKEPSFLALDHKNNDGCKERRSLGLDTGGENFYRYVIKQKFPDRYQLLCHNCNFSKHINKGICIHKIKK